MRPLQEKASAVKFGMAVVFVSLGGCYSRWVSDLHQVRLIASMIKSVVRILHDYVQRI